MPDNFAQIAYMTVTQTVINTLTFNSLGLRLGSGNREAWILHMVEWWFHEDEILLDADRLEVALTTNNNITSLDLADPGVITHLDYSINEIGTAATISENYNPHVRKYTDLPGGGLLILPNPLYIAIMTTGYAAVSSAFARLYYTRKALKDADYVDLVEMARIQT